MCLLTKPTGRPRSHGWRSRQGITRCAATECSQEELRQKPRKCACWAAEAAFILNPFLGSQIQAVPWARRPQGSSTPSTSEAAFPSCGETSSSSVPRRTTGLSTGSESQKQTTRASPSTKQTSSTLGRQVEPASGRPFYRLEN